MLFLTEEVLQEGSREGEMGQRTTALAGTEESLTAFTPLGARRFRTSPAFLGPQAIRRARVMGEAKIPQAL
jgi:hypothetical protein